MAMSEQFDLAMQIVRENFRGVARQVYERDGVIVVEMAEGAGGLDLPDQVRGYRVKRVDVGTMAREHASDREREGSSERSGTSSPSTRSSSETSSTKSAAERDLDQARAENQRLKDAAARKAKDDAARRELDELQAENARLKAQSEGGGDNS